MEPNATTEPTRKPGPVWQPLTFGGVAAFAPRSLARLLVVQLVFAIAASASVLYFFKTTWFATITESLKALPDHGSLVNGRLEWQGPSPKILSEGPFLTLLVDLDNTGQAGQVADVQLGLGRSEFTFSSLAGQTKVPYETNWYAPVNRLESGPWWGAWEPIFAGGIFLGTFLSLFISWAALATVYTLPVWLIAFFSDRKVTFSGCWRLAGAALMPGALLMSASILFYAMRRLPLPGLGIMMVVHLLVGLIYVFVSPFSLPRREEKFSIGSNPFGEAAAPAEKSNPFTGGK